jgi:hypothetical protein
MGDQLRNICGPCARELFDDSTPDVRKLAHDAIAVSERLGGDLGTCKRCKQETVLVAGVDDGEPEPTEH